MMRNEYSQVTAVNMFQCPVSGVFVVNSPDLRCLSTTRQGAAKEFDKNYDHIDSTCLKQLVAVGMRLDEIGHILLTPGGFLSCCTVLTYCRMPFTNRRQYICIDGRLYLEAVLNITEDWFEFYDEHFEFDNNSICLRIQIPILLSIWNDCMNKIFNIAGRQTTYIAVKNLYFKRYFEFVAIHAFGRRVFKFKCKKKLNDLYREICNKYTYDSMNEYLFQSIDHMVAFTTAVAPPFFCTRSLFAIGNEVINHQKFLNIQKQIEKDKKNNFGNSKKIWRYKPFVIIDMEYPMNENNVLYMKQMSRNQVYYCFNLIINNDARRSARAYVQFFGHIRMNKQLSDWASGYGEQQCSLFAEEDEDAVIAGILANYRRR
jgi:hypothetical protein